MRAETCCEHERVHEIKNRHNTCWERKFVQWFNLIHAQQDAYPHRKDEFVVLHPDTGSPDIKNAAYVLATPVHYCPSIVKDLLLPTCRLWECKDYSYEELDAVSHFTVYDFLYNCDRTSICTHLNIGITSVRNKVFFSARFYCALLTLDVSAPFGGHPQVVRKHKNYLRQSLYIQRIRWVGMYKVNIVVR
jgi:hypothetical protein